jgi:hypothetical protein
MENVRFRKFLTENEKTANKLESVSKSKAESPTFPTV